MSITFMQEALKIADNFCGRKDPESIDRQGRLNQVLVVVIIFHGIMGISFVKMEEYERKHPRVIHEVDVSFITAAKAPRLPLILPSADVPAPLHLTEAKNPNPGAAMASKPRQSSKISLPAKKMEQLDEKFKPETASPVNRQTTEAPPIAVNKTSQPKPSPFQLSAEPEAPASLRNGLFSQTDAKGAPHDASLPDDSKSDGFARGEHGNDAEQDGKGPGDLGKGSGYDLAGTPVSMQIEEHKRAMGNIAPYRRNLVLRLAQNWHPRKKYHILRLQLEIAKDGKLLAATILTGSGNRHLDADALSAAESTSFEPLPDWYRGETLIFKIDMASLSAPE
ncbi:MAG: TonB family protein [Candidatus Obscuribacterales bacterium]|nr:TonB family protein [Candidatus Obscuribacterales bacterium]